MNPGYDNKLYLLAFDHRGSFEHGLFGATPPISPEIRSKIIELKNIIFDANQLAISEGASKEICGILVDEEFGTDVARRALSEGVPLAMPVEKSGQEEFEFQYGDDFGSHIEAFNPTFAKVLVRYNPEGDATMNDHQTARLAILSRWLKASGRRLLFELLVPATTAQLDRFEGHQREFDAELRPQLVLEIIRRMQAAGVEADIWKIEGLDSREACDAVAQQSRAGGRDEVKCIILGRGADLDQVLNWIRIAAPVQGFDGFAVGRTLWQEALKGFVAGTLSREATVKTIADRYLSCIRAYQAAAGR
jgi:myo-inositol catabolism protein IolC